MYLCIYMIYGISHLRLNKNPWLSTKNPLLITSGTPSGTAASAWGPHLAIQLPQALLHTRLLSFQNIHPIEQTILGWEKLPKLPCETTN